MVVNASTAERRAPRTQIDGATVTVVIPCYNYARFLPQAVASVLGQESVSVDIVVVDDASTDDSLSVAEEIAANDPRVRVLANPRNLGAVATFNRGLEQATGEYLVRLDADDLLTPGSLRRAVAVMQYLPGVGLVYGHPIHFAGDVPPPARTDPLEWTVWAGSDWLAARCVDGTNVITSPEVVMRRSVVDVVGGQLPLAHTHDMEMWLRIAAHSDVAYIVGADQAWHREHPGSLSTRAEDPLVILAEIRDAFDLLFDGLGGAFERGAELHAASRRAIALEAIAEARRLLDRGRATDQAGRLLAFAAEVDPEIRSTRVWRGLDRRSASAMPAAAAIALGVVPRGRRWVRRRLRMHRWHRAGVFEPVRARPRDAAYDAGRPAAHRAGLPATPGSGITSNAGEVA
ncbi:glycosyltransferase family 2 protein [Agromyces badenianii]|uniref:glycosyltransferase family 2 protein n=1 Tax=Agromyces badenianii TaxID=2080742 RepID=UPI000D599935|nr:glycosyltransferase family 2 protein [Agromyces badenianii]PWC05171.1 glycosyl transferase [Agromyces badenianii]